MDSCTSMIKIGCLFADFLGYMESAGNRIVRINIPLRISRSAICMFNFFFYCFVIVSKI